MLTIDDLDWSKCKLTPLTQKREDGTIVEYQKEGTLELVNKPLFFLADDMGTGKSKQVIDAACFLFELGKIDTVVLTCPAQVKINWLDKVLGQIIEHCFVPSNVWEFNSRKPFVPSSPERLTWVVVSYELVRFANYEKTLSNELRGRKVMFIFEESSALGNWKSAQNEACKKLMHQCGDRGVLLNGTPGNPIKLYGQFEVLGSEIIGCKNFYHFQARYVNQVTCKDREGKKFKKLVEFVNKDLLDKRIKPYILRREKQLGIGKYYTLEGVTLTASTWRLYREMRDQMLAQLDSGEIATASVAIVKVVRLAQLTSGYLGGLEGVPVEDSVREVSHEKVDAFLDWYDRMAEKLEVPRILAWCRFRAEIERLAKALTARGIKALKIVGGQNAKEREAAVREFQAGDESKPCVIVGQVQAGGLGLNLVKCHVVAFVSTDSRADTRKQAEDRVYRTGQLFDCSYTDFLASGPDGQKTMDHQVAYALRRNIDIHTWTMADWRRALADE